ncbi:MAG: tetratricopeptide repeat protein [Elusimicrobiota bacterium]
MKSFVSLLAGVFFFAAALPLAAERSAGFTVAQADDSEPLPGEQFPDESADELWPEEPAEEPAIEEPEEAKAEEPAVEEPEEAKAEEPAIEEPEEAKAEEPAVEEPEEAKAEEPAVEEPEEAKAEEPAIEEPEEAKAEEPEEEPVEVKAEEPAPEPAQKTRSVRRPRRSPAAQEAPPAAKKEPADPNLSPDERRARAQLSFLKDAFENLNPGLFEHLLREIDGYLQSYGGYPYSDEALSFRARIYQQQKDHPAEAVTLLRLLHEYPKSGFARDAKKRVTELAGQSFKDHRALLEVLAEGPAGQDSSVNLARLLQSLAKLRNPAFFKALRVEFDQFLNRYPTHAWADRIARLAADNHGVVDDYRAQVLYYQKLIALYPDSPMKPELMVASGDILAEKVVDTDAAVAAYRKVTEEMPEKEEAQESFNKIAQLYEKERRYDDSIDSLESLVSKYPGTDAALQALLSIARIYNDRTKQYAETVQTYERVADMFEGNPGVEALRKAADIAGESMKDSAMQIAILDRIVKDYPQRDEAAEALFESAQIHEKQSLKMEKAIELYKKLQEEYSNHRLARKASSRRRKLEKKLGN